MFWFDRRRSWTKVNGSGSARRPKCSRAFNTPTSSDSTTTGRWHWPKGNTSSSSRNWWRPALWKRNVSPLLTHFPLNSFGRQGAAGGWFDFYNGKRLSSDGSAGELGHSKVAWIAATSRREEKHFWKQQSGQCCHLCGRKSLSNFKSICGLVILWIFDALWIRVSK